MRTRLALVIPVFNDWESFCQLLSALDLAAPTWNVDVDIVAIDDGSYQLLPTIEQAAASLKNILSVTIISLACNLGHPRAIAVGLVHVYRLAQHDQCLVMDCDGEDRPEDIAPLLRASAALPHAIITAKRAQRLEGWRFRLFYKAYKSLFRLLTGRRIDFGNFCLIPTAQLARIVYMSELWNHFPATLIRSRAPLMAVKTAKGRRYAGRSTMNFVTLIVLGLSAIAVFGDVSLVRLAIFSLSLTLWPLLLAVVVLCVRLFTEYAIPGWTTSVWGFAIMYVIQLLALSVTGALALLSNRSHFPFVPANQAVAFVKETRCLRHSKAKAA